MAFFGLRRWPVPIARPLWPFGAASLITLWGVMKIQNIAVASEAHANDPRNPYAAQIAKERSAAHH